MLSCVISAQVTTYEDFNGNNDKYGNLSTSNGYSLWSIGGSNAGLQASVWELVSDTSSPEVGLFSTEVWASSSSASDASGGVGAQSLEVFYYTTAGAIATKTIAMNGQTTVSVAIVKQIIGARVKYEGTSGQQGDIYIHSATVEVSGVPSDTQGAVYAKIPSDQGATQNGLFYVPPTVKKAVLKGIFIAGNGTSLTTRFMSKKNGLAERALMPNFYSNLGGIIEMDVNIPLSPGELIWVEAIGTAASDVSVGLFVYLKE